MTSQGAANRIRTGLGRRNDTTRFTDAIILEVLNQARLWLILKHPEPSALGEFLRYTDDSVNALLTEVSRSVYPLPADFGRALPGATLDGYPLTPISLAMRGEIGVLADRTATTSRPFYLLQNLLASLEDGGNIANTIVWGVNPNRVAIEILPEPTVAELRIRIPYLKLPPTLTGLDDSLPMEWPLALDDALIRECIGRCKQFDHEDASGAAEEGRMLALIGVESRSWV